MMMMVIQTHHYIFIGTTQSADVIIHSAPTKYTRQCREIIYI